MSSPVVALKRMVAEYIDARAPNGTAVWISWKGRARQDNQGQGRANRVVFEIQEDGGKIAPPHGPGPRLDRRGLTGDEKATSSWRSIATWEEKLVVSVWAIDVERSTDEEAQLDAVVDLFRVVMQAVQNAFRGANPDLAWTRFEWGGVKRTVPNERNFGLELRADLVLKHHMPDEPVGVVYPSPVVERGPAL